MVCSSASRPRIRTSTTNLTRLGKSTKSGALVEREVAAEARSSTKRGVQDDGGGTGCEQGGQGWASTTLSFAFDGGWRCSNHLVSRAQWGTRVFHHQLLCSRVAFDEVVPTPAPPLVYVSHSMNVPGPTSRSHFTFDASPSRSRSMRVCPILLLFACHVR